jgi:hypothetical protein
MLSFHCACGKRIDAPEEYEGRRVTCPQCGLAVIARREEGAGGAAAAAQAAMRGAPAPAPPLAQPPHIPPPPPAYIPAPASPIAYATPLEAGAYANPPRRVNGLGIASLILGIFALMFSWIPLCGLVPALLLALVGGILGAVGFFAAAADRRTGIGFPIAGVVTCVAAPVLNILLTVIRAARPPPPPPPAAPIAPPPPGPVTTPAPAPGPTTAPESTVDESPGTRRNSRTDSDAEERWMLAVNLLRWSTP